MSLPKFLTQDYPLPPFSSYRKAMFTALIFVLLPNVFFWLMAWYMGIARPLLNWDYLWVSALLLAPLPYKLNKILGSLLLIVMIIVDFMMMAVQLFPFMDISAIVYLLPFISTAPARYLIAIAVAVVYIVFMPYLLGKLVRHVSAKWVWAWCILLAIVGYNLRSTYYRDVPPERFGRTNYLVANSQIKLYLDEYGNEFRNLTLSKPELSPYYPEKDYATKQIKQPYSDKILFIIAESWGVAREPEVQRAMLQKIYDQQNQLDFIHEGFFDFSGATVQGELRELCQLNVSGGYALGKVDDAAFSGCLPNILKKQGYYTVALHGASSQLYDRNNWYGKAGFQQVYFAEHLLDKPRCHIFNGVCDSAMTEMVGEVFKQNQQKKTMVYWLTLTSHAPYSPKDMVNPRLDCQKYGLFEGDICNNMRLETQMFDDLAQLISKPEMKGVEVLVVGDHMPPIIGDAPLYKNLHWQDVSWVHFKIK